MAIKKNPNLNVAQESPIDIAFDPFNQIANSLTTPTTYVINPPANYCYWYWPLNLAGGLDETMISELRVYANTTLIYKISGTNLDLINQWYKMPAVGAVSGNKTLIIPFRRFGLRSGAQDIDFAGQSFVSGTAKDNGVESALNCGSPDSNGNEISTLKLEIDFVNTPAMGALIATCFGVGTLPWAGGPGLVPFLETSTFNSSISTTNNVTKNNALKVGDINHTLLDALFFLPPSGTLDDWQLWYNNTLWLKRTTAQMRFLETLDNLRTWQAGMVPIDFSADGYGDESLYVASANTDLRIYMSDTASEGVTVIQKSFGFLF